MDNNGHATCLLNGFWDNPQSFHRAFKLNYLALYFIIEIQVSSEFSKNRRNSERMKGVEIT
jgi:hypothetical protein